MKKIKWYALLLAAANLFFLGTSFADELPIKGSVREVVQDRFTNVNCAVTTDNELWCWGGDNTQGQVGNGTREYQPLPVKILDDVSTVKLYGGGTCAIKTSGDLYCWGYNGLGDGVAEGASASPVKVFENVASVYVALYEICAVTTTGELYCSVDSPAPIKVLDEVESVIYWNEFNSYTMWWQPSPDLKYESRSICAIKTSGELYCWNRGDESPTKIMDDVKNAIMMSEDAHRVARQSNDPILYALKNSGELYRVGQDGGMTLILDNVSSFGYFWALTTTGELYRWGQNDKGQYGNGTETICLGVSCFDSLKVLDDVSTVSEEFGSICAVKTTGDLLCWGDNRYGIIGSGDEAEVVSIPVKVLDGVSSVNVGLASTTAIKTTGELFYWGTNGMDVVLITPSKMLDNVLHANNLRLDTCATKGNGELYCWGYNNFRTKAEGEWLLEPLLIFNESGIPEQKVPATGVVTPKTKLLQPYVIARPKKLSVYMQRFAEASLTPVDVASLAVTKSVKFKYELMIIEKRGKKGTFKTVKTLKKNTLNIKRKKASVYTIKYRVIITQGKKTKRTKWSKAVKVTTQTK